MANQLGQSLPQWQSHKKVRGGKITDADMTNWWLDSGGVVVLTPELKSRVPEGTDPIGGYYVQYADGFESWSPAKAFEEGYTRI